MGIADLMGFLRKTQPRVFHRLPSRWADPRVRGKRVAIDATLLTNAMHISQSKADDPNVRNALLSWYWLIRDMRAEGVKPIAIWDEKGTRDWKAAEAKKRLSNRARALARRNHEDTRVQRLHDLRAAIAEFGDLSEDEQESIQKYWRERGWTRHGPQALGPDDKRKELDVFTNDSVHSFVSNFKAILQNFSANDLPYQGKRISPPQPDVEEAVGHVHELEVLVGEKAGQDYEVAPLRPDEEEQDRVDDTPKSMIDEKLQELLPSETYTETPQQTALTNAEGAIVDDFMQVEPESSQMSEDALKSMRRHKNRPVIASVGLLATDPAPLLDKVDKLISFTPVVRETYDRALSLPTKEDHEECKELLLKMGVPVITAAIPFEAEGLASNLAKAGLVDYVGTEDSDVIGYEGPMLRALSSRSAALVNVSGREVRTALGLSPPQFLDFCILLGTDASERIPKVGPVTAYKLIQKFGSIEAILADEPDIASRIPKGYMDTVHSARTVFSSSAPLPKQEELEGVEVDLKEVEKWLEERHGLSVVEPVQVNKDDYGDAHDSVSLERYQARRSLESGLGSTLEGKCKVEPEWESELEGELDWEEIVREAIERAEEDEDQVRVTVSAALQWQEVRGDEQRQSM